VSATSAPPGQGRSREKGGNLSAARPAAARASSGRHGSHFRHKHKLLQALRHPINRRWAAPPWAEPLGNAGLGALRLQRNGAKQSARATKALPIRSEGVYDGKSLWVGWFWSANLRQLQCISARTAGQDLFPRAGIAGLGESGRGRTAAPAHL